MLDGSDVKHYPDSYIEIYLNKDKVKRYFQS